MSSSTDMKIYLLYKIKGLKRITIENPQFQTDIFFYQ